MGRGSEGRAGTTSGDLKGGRAESPGGAACTCSASSCKAKFVTGPAVGQPGQSLTTQRPCCLCGLHVKGHYSGNQQPPLPTSGLAGRRRQKATWGSPGSCPRPRPPTKWNRRTRDCPRHLGAVDQNYDLAYFPAQKRFCHHAACPQYALCVPRTGKHLGLPPTDGAHVSHLSGLQPNDHTCDGLVHAATTHALYEVCLPECSAICGPSQHGLI